VANSKMQMVAGAGVQVILGLYVLGFSAADQAVNEVSQSQAYYDQARQIADVGMRFATGDMGSNLSHALPSGNVSLIGGSVTYTGDRPPGLPGSQVRVTSVGTYNDYEVTIVAILKHNGTKWVTESVYQKPDANGHKKVK
jgi:hypothetical protein